jgi:hypothetical protein
MPPELHGLKPDSSQQGRQPLMVFRMDDHFLMEQEATGCNTPYYENANQQVGIQKFKIKFLPIYSKSCQIPLENEL